MSRCVVMGVTGGIAAYKSCEIVSRLKKAGCDVYVIMTAHAAEFVKPLTFETLSGHPVVTDMFDREAPWEVEHISLAQRADVFLIAPATANIIAKMANGIADDMLSTTVLATGARLLIAPAMNTNMYLHPATQHNLSVLKERGAEFIGPDSGLLACGDIGPGRMSEPAVIADAVCQALTQNRDLEGRRVLVTAGPTREAIDPVRYISNHSSGKMGYELARAARARGAEVTLISGPVSLDVPYGVERVSIETTEDMLKALLDRFDDADLVIKAAAPGDFRMAETAPQKIKKRKDSPGIRLDLVENPDIAATLGKRKTHQVLVVFAAETEHLTENAAAKLAKKNADLIVANDVTAEGAGFNTDTNIATVIDRSGRMTALPQMPKSEMADRILDEAVRYLKQ